MRDITIKEDDVSHMQVVGHQLEGHFTREHTKGKLCSFLQHHPCCAWLWDPRGAPLYTGGEVVSVYFLALTAGIPQEGSHPPPFPTRISPYLTCLLQYFLYCCQLRDGALVDRRPLPLLVVVVLCIIPASVFGVW